jgi:L-serine deaminase
MCKHSSKDSSKDSGKDSSKDLSQQSAIGNEHSNNAVLSFDEVGDVELD